MNRKQKKELKARLKQEVMMNQQEQSPRDYETSIKALVYWLNLLSLVLYIPLLVAMVMIAFKILKVVGQLNLQEMIK